MNRSTDATGTQVPVLDARTVIEHPDARVIDLRTPSEFADDQLPGAINLPLFDDDERAVVGLLYKRDSPQRAFEHGVEVVRSKVVQLARAVAEAGGVELALDRVLERTEGLVQGGLTGLEARLEPAPMASIPAQPIVLHCWRGGLRSRSVVALLRQLGLERVVGLEGGYKAYRACVRADLENWVAPATFVLRGLTGVGKTLVLREIERLRPGWTLDLEGAAGHRSSLLGMVGLEPVSQKTFESRLAARVRAGFPGPVVFEGESRKVGDAIIPAGMWAALCAGSNLLLEADVERRVDVLIEDYLANDDARPLLREQLCAVQKRMEGPAVDLAALLDGGQERELVRVLLERYYDPLYRHSEKQQTYDGRIDAADAGRAAEAVVSLIESS